MFLAAKDDASQRTKNRLREHGPQFHVTKGPVPVMCLQRDLGIHVVSHKTGWKGWLPWKEVFSFVPTVKKE